MPYITWLEFRPSSDQYLLVLNSLSETKSIFEKNKDKHHYHENVCVIQKLYDNICTNCGCYPNYAKIKHYFKANNECDKPCSFFRHATCASFIINNRDWLNRTVIILNKNATIYRCLIIKLKKSMRTNMHFIFISSTSYPICPNEFQVMFEFVNI